MPGTWPCRGGCTARSAREILGLADQWTGELSASAGIHAGWIFWLKFYGFATAGVEGADEWFWGTRKLVDGWLAFVALVVVLTAVVLARRRMEARMTAEGRIG